MFKKLNDFDTKYSNLFFGISLLIILVVLVYISATNNKSVKTCEMPANSVKDYSSYSYSIKYTKEGNNIDLFIKKYGSKYLIEKNENDNKNTYYFHYTDLLEKASDGSFIKYRKNQIVNGLDNKYLILDYINEISLDSKVNNETELTCYVNRQLSIKMCVNLDDTIELKGDNYTLLYEIKDVGNISDFNVKIGNINDVEEIQSNQEIFTE